MSRTSLHISEDISLPLDAATQTIAVIARKGAGKTYAASKLAEQFLEHGVQSVVIDTVGNWYGLRIAANGKDRGFDIPVLGGLRGDVPLTPESGALIADLIVDTGRSFIIDLSQFSLGNRKKFATAFGEQLWKRKKGEPEPSALHVFLEECQLIIPQFVGRDDARMVGIWEEIVRLGRNYGIGVTMITQRPQSVNKEVLTQTECLLVLQVNGVPERKALKEWIVHQGASVDLLNELPSLPVRKERSRTS
jgi:DNA helicase HerA-like ATPase